MPDERKALGKKGEKIAEKLLRRKGHKIVERNYRCRYGEIDLITVDAGYVVFVEVKTRSGEGLSPPQQAVDSRKQKRLARLAAYYLTHTPHLKVPPDCRFDVVAIVESIDGKKASVEHFENAFLLKQRYYTL